MIPSPTFPAVRARGWQIPAGTGVGAASLILHRHRTWWTEPDRFDPDRFAPERAEDKQHATCSSPSEAAHLCIGNHLAEVIVKAVLARLLVRHRLTADPCDHVVIAPVPIPKPKSALMLTLH